MATPRKPRSGPGSRTGDAARSGPDIPRTQRRRRPVEITLGDAARETLDAAASRTEESRSALVEALVLSHAARERHLSPAILERLVALATRRGDDFWLVLDEVIDIGLDMLESSEGAASEGAAPGDPVPVVRETAGGGVAISYRHQR